MKLPPQKTPPKGEKSNDKIAQELRKIAVDTYGGRVHIDWDHNSNVTSMGQLAFFIEFLKRSELFDRWVSSCPLALTSPNAPQNADILGTLLLSILSGHTRYAHISSVKTDRVNAPLLGMNKIVSEDSVRRALSKIPEAEGLNWLSENFHHCYGEVLHLPWVLDVDTTVKCLYGYQEGAVVGYNPRKPGRPSHSYHTYMMANTRLITEVDVMAGNESSASHTAPNLFAWLDKLPREQYPAFMRGDSAFGTDAVMRDCEARNIAYLFKLKQTKNVKKLIAKVMTQHEWTRAGQGWQGTEDTLQLQGWQAPRRVVILRRVMKSKDVGMTQEAEAMENALPVQMSFHFAEEKDDIRLYEFAVLVTSLPDEVMTISYHYRDRADSENNFDELKNQWGWAGFTTQDLHRCRLMAGIIALIYNWWTIFVRLLVPEKHMEAITSRPLLLQAVGRQVQHGGQKTIQVNSNHAHVKKIEVALSTVSTFFKTLKPSAEQLTVKERMRRILYRAFSKFLEVGGKSPPNLLTQPQ